MEAIKLNPEITGKLSEKIMNVLEGLSQDQAEHILKKVQENLKYYSPISSKFRSQIREVVYGRPASSLCETDK